MHITNHVKIATSVNAAPKLAGDDVSSAGDFSATLTKLFKPARENKSNDSTEAASTHESKRPKPAGQGSYSATDVAAAPYALPQPPSTPAPEQHQSGAKLFGTVQEPGDSSDLSLQSSPEAGALLNNPSAGSVAGPQQAGGFEGLSAVAAKADGASGVSVTPQQDGTTDDLSAGDPSDGISDHAFGPSQDDSGVDGISQRPVTGTPILATSAEAALLASAQAAPTATNVPNGDDSLPAVTSDVATSPAGRTGQAGTTQSTAPKPSTKDEATTQIGAGVSSQMAHEAISGAAQTEVAPQSHKASVNPTLKALAFKQDDNTVNFSPVDKNASLQSSIENGGAASITSVTGNGITGADNSSAKQEDGGSAESDRRSKDDAVSAVVEAMPQAPLLQSTPTSLHLASTPTSHPVQQNSSFTASPASSTNTSAHLTDLDPSATGDVKTVVSTSKLLQTLNQSEMRVGMRSSEFGDISIRTSATHDSMLTQISLDHAELARSLATHIPDMQARLAVHGNHEVRISAADQSAGSGSSMSDTRSGTQGGRQQDGSSRSFAAPYETSSVFDSALPTAALANTLQSVRQNGRLDIQA